MVDVPTTDRPALATNFGGGGAFGYGFNMGIAHGLRAAGLDVVRYPMVGTSAGSHTVATLRTGLDFDGFCDLWESRVGEQTDGFWGDGYGFSEAAYREVDDPDVSAIAVRLRPRRRVVLRSDRYPIADITAASSAAVPVLRPHRIDGVWYADGGIVSLASGDLTPAADLMLLVTPFARAGQGVAGWAGARQARREIASWTRRHGGDVLHVVPTAEMVAFGGRRLRDIVDIRIGRAVYPLAVQYAGRVADELRRMNPSLFA